MNILMLGWELPPHNSGGLGVACYHMSKALAAEGSVIDFVVPYMADHTSITHMNVHCATELSPLHRYGMGAYDTSPLIGNASEHALHTDIRAVQKQYISFTKELVRKKKPHAIHAHDWLTLEAGVAAKEITNAPLIAHVHATEFDRAGGHHGNPLVHEIEQHGLQMADKIIAVSDLTKRIIVEKYDIPADKIEVMHNGFDASSLGPHSYDARTYRYLEHLKNDGYTVVATVTRFTIQKGLTYFLEAAARASQRYDKLVFLLAGDGEQRDELLLKSAELGIADKVFFTGFVRGKQWRDSYNVADIFVMSSVSEPFGLTALEAAHHNSAVVLTRQSGVGEILHSVFRYDFWDVDALADQLVGIALSPALKQSLTENIKHEYSRLSWHDVARQCTALYRRLTIGVQV